MTFITGYVTLATFIKGYVTLSYLSWVMSHCHICQGLCRIVIFIKVYVSLWHYQGLYDITTLSHGSLQWAFNKHYVALWSLVCYRGHLIGVMSHCDVSHGLCYISDIHQGLCHIVIFVKGYVTLSYFSRVMSHCDVCQCWRFNVMLSRVISHYD